MNDLFVLSIIDWLLDWLTAFNPWLSDWPSDWLIDWPIDWLTGRVIDWLTWRLIDWLAAWLIDLPIDWLIDWLINWTSDWLTGWVMDWLAECLLSVGVRCCWWPVRSLSSTERRDLFIRRFWRHARTRRRSSSSKSLESPTYSKKRLQSTHSYPVVYSGHLYSASLAQTQLMWTVSNSVCCYYHCNVVTHLYRAVSVYQLKGAQRPSWRDTYSREHW